MSILILQSQTDRDNKDRFTNVDLNPDSQGDNPTRYRMSYAVASPYISFNIIMCSMCLKIHTVSNYFIIKKEPRFF